LSAADYLVQSAAGTGLEQIFEPNNSHGNVTELAIFRAVQ
jgi:hypothetical protein